MRLMDCRHHPSIEKLKHTKESGVWDEAAAMCQECPDHAPEVEYLVAENSSLEGINVTW
jgi:hypothetical protein